MNQVKYKFDDDTGYFVTDLDCMNCAYIHPKNHRGVRLMESEVDGVIQPDAYLVMDDFGTLVGAPADTRKFSLRN